jgi:hypothetical protein
MKPRPLAADDAEPRASPSTSGLRRTAIQPAYILRMATRIPQTAFLPQHIQRGPQRRTRMRLDPLQASLAPQLQRLPPLPSRPLIRIERHQLRRRRHSQRRTTMGGHHGTQSRNSRFSRDPARNTSPISPSSESGHAFTQACRAICQRRNGSAQDAPSSGATHSSRQNVNSSAGIFTSGGLRCIATIKPRPQLSKLAVLSSRHLVPPTPLSSRTSMPLPRTQPRLLTLIRKIQRVDKPPQQQPMILNDLQQRIRPRLPAIPSNHQRRRPQLSLKQRNLIRRSRRLTQNLNLASIQHKRGGHRVPQLPSSRFKAIWRLKRLIRHTPTPYPHNLQGFYPEQAGDRDAGTGWSRGSSL